MSRFDTYASDEMYYQETWFDGHYPELFSWYVSRGHSNEEAQELAVDELVERWNNLHKNMQ